MAGIFGRSSVLGTLPIGGLGISPECNSEADTYDPEQCSARGGESQIYDNACAPSFWLYSPTTVKIQKQMIARGATALKADGKWGPCTEQAYQTLYGEPVSAESLARHQNINCTSFQQAAEKGGWGTKPNPAECKKPYIIKPKQCLPGEVLTDRNLCVPAEQPPTPPPQTCAAGFKFDLATAQCIIDQLTCPAGQKPSPDGLICIPDCGQGTHLDSATMTCLADQFTCPAGQQPDPAGGSFCVPRDLPVTPPEPEKQQRLGGGLCRDASTHWDASTGGCVPNTTTQNAPVSSTKTYNLSALKLPTTLRFGLPSESQAAKRQASSLNIAKVALRPSRFLSAQKDGGTKVNLVSGTIDDTWINGIPNWLVVVAALAAVGGGYYYYQKKQKKPGSSLGK